MFGGHLYSKYLYIKTTALYLLYTDVRRGFVSDLRRPVLYLCVLIGDLQQQGQVGVVKGVV